ncbi:MAG TPA: SDR family oxidoreductase [Sphingobium sp.]|uniref:SDR family NAD(P)-dependent oxidoreductase n=1 Tax=Sphingobium sp. TaxID=1912891 RepID=UPI002ECFEC9D
MTQDNKGIALVTGASSGIGAVYADRLAKRGYDLILVARDIARLEALANRLHSATGSQVEVIGADLTDPASIDALAARIEGEARLTLLVNNAGVALSDTLTEAPASEVARLITLNIAAPALLARAAIRAFKTRGTGRVINISSVLALAPEILEGVYSGSKAFLLNLTQGLNHELAGTDIHVQAVLPGATRTEIWERSGKDVDSFPADWVMGVDDLVDAALTGFDRGEAVTIPPLQDTADWNIMQDARLRLAGQLSRSEVAPRYRSIAEA